MSALKKKREYDEELRLWNRNKQQAGWYKGGREQVLWNLQSPCVVQKAIMTRDQGVQIVAVLEAPEQVRPFHCLPEVLLPCGHPLRL